MTSNQLAARVATPAAPAPSHLGQATAVEQSRAVAEVQAAVIVAQQRPRDTTRALAEMRGSCRNKRLAERAFYRFPRAGGAVTGPTIHLARELARVWGNVQYGIAELRRDDVGGFSEMQAWAWDLETNTRTSQTFVVPHMRDKTGGPERLVDMRDIYENNTNQGSRRVRQAIFAVLPPWLTEEAQDLCRQTLSDGGGKSLPQQIADSVKAFEGLGITAAQLDQKIGRPASAWTEHDVVSLRVIFKSLRNNEISRDEEFPPLAVTGAEIVGTQPAQPASAKPTRSTRSAASTPPPAPAAAPVADELPVEDPPGGYDEGGWPQTRTPGGV